MPTQLFLASTLYGAAALAAALDAGCLPAADRRLLLVSTNTAVPELSTPLDRMPGFAPLRRRFDQVLSWNETIAPLHPAGWSPRPEDVPLWERQLRERWGLTGRDLQLVVESIQVNPAQAVCRLFPDAPVDVYADGLMSYGPTRNRLDPLLGTRIRRLLHPDLLPGLRPLLLTEFGVPSHTIPTEAFTAVLREVAAASPTPPPPDGGAAADAPEHGPALLLGQHLAALGVLTPEEEERLHLRMVRGAAALGHRTLLFKAHPSAPVRSARALQRAADELGVTLTVLREPVLAEVLFQRLRPALVVGCFSTALFTAGTCYRLPVARTGTELLLERLTPYQNSNRVPVTLADAVLPDLDDPAAVAAWTPPDRAWVTGELTELLHTVGYTMQSRLHPELRATAERYLRTRPGHRTRRYVKRRRLTALGLPGGLPRRFALVPRTPRVRRAVRRLRALRDAARR